MRFSYDGALLAQVRVIPDLKQMIVNAQKDDVKLQEIVQLVSIGDKTDYAIYENGSFWYGGHSTLISLVQEKFRGRNLFYGGGEL